MEEPDYQVILEDAKKYFFAEDIMSYFMISCGFEPWYRIPVTMRCFRLIPRAFNEVIETAVCYLYSRISVFHTFQGFEANGMINSGTFLLFAHRLENRYFPNGYNAQKFLYFSTHLAYMATSFYKVGNHQVPMLAVYYIVRVMTTEVVPQDEFWNSLCIAALGFVKVALTCGFVKMSGFESMKVQFVVNRLFEEETADSNVGILEDRKINEAEKKDLLKLSAELKSKISMINDYNVRNESNETKPKMEKPSAQYDESFNRELSSDHNSTNRDESFNRELSSDHNSTNRDGSFNRELSSDHNSTNRKESLESGVEEKIYHENKCTNSLDTTSETESEDFLERKYRIFEVLNAVVNEPEDYVFPENCETTFNDNRDFILKCTQSTTMNAETPKNIKSKHNVTSIKNHPTESTEKDSKNFDTTKQEMPPFATGTHDQKLSPSISRDKNEFIFDNESFKNSSNLFSKDESFNTTDNESARPYNPEECPNAEKSENEVCRLKTVDFDICDEFVMDMARTSGTDIELFGETHEGFLSYEDFYNCTFDILSVVHSLVTNSGAEILDIYTIP